MNKNKTVANDTSVDEFINKLTNSQQIEDSKKLAKLMTTISGCTPKMWGPTIIGFDTYHYKYDSGREGDMCVIGFSPRKNELVVYLVDGVSNYQDDLMMLGKHRYGKSCLYIKDLDSINIEVLSRIITRSYTYTKGLDGSMHRAR